VAGTVDALLDAGARVSDIGRVVAVAHDALLQRLLRDAEAALGPPPAPYAWLVLGSEGRLEQTLRTDQDNALAYADDAPPAAAAYFAALAERVVNAMVECGFPRCPGDIMATNPQWRQPIGAWQGYFRRWVSVPDEEALMRAAIFFDFRQIYGALDAAAALRPVVAEARGNTLFLARLAHAALRQAPPLTIFRQVQLERHGELRGTLDLKLRGSGLVVDLARLFALEAGVAATPTVARLRESWPESSLGQEEAERLIAAFELIGLLRLRHQRAQLARGAQPSNQIVFAELSPLERRELKEALQVIAAVQRGVAAGFHTDALG
jgi:CBS domain-containing protein